MTFDFPRMPWKDVVATAAEVAKNGFNVTHDLGRYSALWLKDIQILYWPQKAEVI